MIHSKLFFALAAAACAVCFPTHAAPPELQAKPFLLSQVRLLDGPFKQRQDVNARYLLEVVDADRLLAGFRAQAGLPEKAKRYGGWEARGINGHSLGHYLSAVSLLHAATGNPVALERVNYIVAELAACQKANGDGYVLPVNKQIYEDLRQGRIQASFFSLNGEWVPNYTLHKVFAGLRDAWRFTGNQQALDVEKRLADYLAGVYQKLNPAQAQEILKAEHGGMNEVFADLTTDTGDARYLELARTVFHHEAVLGPLERGEDRLNGQHGNTQIPKIVGLARAYELTGEDSYRNAAFTFWDSVVNKRSFCIGGHGNSEHFFPPEKFQENLKPHTAETCNSYNMIKLTGHMFSWKPDPAHMDFVERTLINHILTNIGGHPGEFGYFLGLESVGTKVFSTQDGAWWCCVGTGMENPARYGEHIYCQSGNTLWVNLFIASELDWKAKSFKLRQQTAFPDSDAVRFTIETTKPVKLALNIRHPYWCANPEVKVNGRPVTLNSSPSSYLTIDRIWSSGEVIDLRLPMTLRTEALPHSDGKTLALLYGPSVLVGVVPSEPGFPDPPKQRWDDHLNAPGKVRGTPPVFVAASKADLLSQFKPTGRGFSEFQATGVIKPRDLSFVPFHRVYQEHYAVYFTWLNPTEWKAREGEIIATETRRANLAAATLDSVQPGFQQSEVEHGFQSVNSESGDFRDRKWRDARNGGWFSYQVAVDSSKPIALVATYFGDDRGRDFDILVDSNHIATQKIDGNPGGTFFNVAYEIPPSITQGKSKVTVRFQAKGDTMAGGLFGLRVVSAPSVKQFTESDAPF
jgi:DUF1680 family protein